MATATQMDTMNEIKVDHNNIKDLFKSYRTEKDQDRRSTLVNTIIREIAVHSEAEEVTVYNTLQKHSEQQAQHFRDEHQALEEILYSIDYTKINDPEFEPKFNKALKMFLEHSDEEETHPGSLADLASKLSANENHALAKAAPQSGGIVQKVMGMATKFPHDAIMEKFQGKTFVPVEELRFQHPATGKVESVKLEGDFFK